MLALEAAALGEGLVLHGAGMQESGQETRDTNPHAGSSCFPFPRLIYRYVPLNI